MGLAAVRIARESSLKVSDMIYEGQPGPFFTSEGSYSGTEE
jgi:hypothetical protein